MVRLGLFTKLRLGAVKFLSIEIQKKKKEGIFKKNISLNYKKREKRP